MTKRAACARCGTTRTIRATFPDGPICWTCYVDATSTIGRCHSCGDERLLVGRDTAGCELCRDCAGITWNFRCPRCGGEGEMYRAEACLRCCIRDDLTALLDDGTGSVPAALRPFLEAIAAMRRPRSAQIWLRNPDVQRILRGLGTGSIPLTHDALEGQAHAKTTTHLRALLVQAGALPARDERLHHFLRHVDGKLDEIARPAERRVVRTYVTWQRTRRLRRRSEDAALDDPAIAYVRQELSVIIDFLAWLRANQRSLAACDQAAVDAWLAGGPSTRDKIRRFVSWAVGHGHIVASCDVPYRRSGPDLMMSDEERIALLRALIDPTPTITLGYRLAGVLVLLYGVPFNRIRRLALDDIHQDGADTSLRFTEEPTLLPPAVAAMVHAQRANRRNMSTAANPQSRWLFPGQRPNEPISREQLMDGTRRLGIHLRGGRNAALRDLLLTVPAGALASLLGYDAATLERHAAQAGTTWVSYASYRLRSRQSTSGGRSKRAAVPLAVASTEASQPPSS